MGNKASKSNDLIQILDDMEKEGKGVYESTGIDMIRIHRLQEAYFVEDDGFAIGPMSRDQVEALGRQKKGFEVLSKSTLDISQEKPNIAFIPNIELKNEDTVMSEMKSKISAEGDIVENNKTIDVIAAENQINICAESSESAPKAFYSINYPYNEKLWFKNEQNDHENSLNLTNDLNTAEWYKCNDFKLSTHLPSIDGPEKGNRFSSRNINQINSNEKNDFESKKIVKNISNLKSPRKSNITVKCFNLSNRKKGNSKDKKILYNFNDIHNMSNSLKENLSSSDNNFISFNIKNGDIDLSESTKSSGKIRFTAYINVKLINWRKQKCLIRRLSHGFNQRFGCTVKLGDIPIKYQENQFYSIHIDGKDHASVLKCRNCLPHEISSVLIEPEDEEDSLKLFCRKWRIYTPYNPTLMKVNGTSATKLSY